MAVQSVVRSLVNSNARTTNKKAARENKARDDKFVFDCIVTQIVVFLQM